MRHLCLLLCIALIGCRNDKEGGEDSVSIDVDEDGDGVAGAEDCDDGDAGVYPGNTETPYDGVDNDCDPSTADDDLDGDGHVLAEDCDDEDASVYPGAVEVCNGVDDDCNGDIDDAVGALFYADEDGDGFGDPEVSAQSCEGNEGYVADDSDCDDTSADISPVADEYCNGVDDDCDGAVDEPESVDAERWYTDADSDGAGDPDDWTEACDAPTGTVGNDDDCDDANGSINPNALEICDGVDNDCDGIADEDDAYDVSTWYADADGDGYGDADYSAVACDAPSGYVADSSDCDDDEASAYPGAAEVCDELDNNCDGDTDEGVTTTYSPDYDGDGYGDDSGRYDVEACAAPSGYVEDSSDCDDDEASAYPGGSERCDGLDNDCDSGVDEGVTTTYYLDADGDGYGRDSSTAEACSAPTSAYTSLGGDCDDNDTAYNPGASQGCDGEDYDCDGSVDSDADGDGYADISCGGDDCDDTDASVLPEPNGGCALGTDCDDLLTQGYTTDGEYTIDQDGYGTGDDPVDVYCEQTFDGGGWTAVFNYMDPQDTSTSAAADMHAALIVNADMSSPVLPDSTSAAVYTSNLDLSQFTEVVYGWAPSDSDDVSHYGTYSDASGLSGDCYLDGYCGAGVAVGSFDIYPTGTTGLTVYTGNSPTYPHVGLGYSGQIILWGYDRNTTSYGPWANWYDTKSCCTSGNTSDIATAGWRYVIYVR
ncbi:MAG: hypothetical protein H6741_28715 [Alphaproteobacteria bacterium]|nr:hypothetical protein [Alphaproteobacteria bacterium]